MFKTALVGGVLFLLGIAAGLAWPRLPASSKHIADPGPKALQQSHQIVAKLEKDNAELRRTIESIQVAARKDTETRRVTEAVTRIRAILEAKKDYAGEHRIGCVDHDGKLQEEFAQIFGLNPEERSAIVAAFDRAQASIDQLTRQHTHCEAKPNGDFGLIVDAFPTEGGRIYDQTVEDVKSALGPDRAAYFQAGSTESLDWSISCFGARSRDITISQIPTRKGVYNINEAWKSTDSSGTGQSTLMEPEMRQQLGGIAELLPSLH